MFSSLLRNCCLDDRKDLQQKTFAINSQSFFFSNENWLTEVNLETSH